jgi:hypothetical protein
VPKEQKQYWLNLFTWQTWQEFLAAGGTVSGFRENRWRTIQGMKPGDYLLCYLTGVSRWVGLLEVTGAPFKGSEPIWKDAEFPARVPVRVVARLEPATAVPVLSMKDRLSAFRNLKSPHAWTGHFRGSPQKWSEVDGQAVVAAVMDAVRSPVERPFAPAKLAKVPPILKTASGQPVTIPDEEVEAKAPRKEAMAASQVLGATDAPAGAEPATSAPQEESAHTEIQWLLAKLACDLGLEVWVAKNDLGKSYKGASFKDLPGLKSKLPLSFDAATVKTIELIDVIWLKGNSIVAAFEIESTTQIYSGLLRMADLIAMQPNLKIPLYLVAPEERQNKVFGEINRPVFAKLSPPMSKMCSFLSFETLRERLMQVGPFVGYLKPEFIEEIAEPCTIEEV